MKENKLLSKPTSRKRRGNSRYFLFFVLILLGLAGLGAGAYYALSNVPWLSIERIQATGNSTVADSLLHQALKPYIGQNLLAVDKRAVEKDVLGFSRIRSVRVGRRLLNTLRIKVVERQACLYVKSMEGDLFPIDIEGVVLEKYGQVYTENLPVVSLLVSNSRLKPGRRLSNPSLDKVLAMHARIMREAPEFLPNISEYYTIDNIVYMIDSRNGTRLIPSSKNLSRQFSRYEFVLDNGNVRQNSILDLRFDNQVVVKAGG
jgi:cell division septal protein FtsQ